MQSLDNCKGREEESGIIIQKKGGEKITRKGKRTAVMGKRATGIPSQMRDEAQKKERVPFAAR